MSTLQQPAETSPPTAARTPAERSPEVDSEASRGPHPPQSPPSPPAKRAPATPPSLDPKQLIGLDQSETEKVIGRPDEVNEGHPATVWRYRSGKCALDLFFYLDLGNRKYRALAYDISTANATITDQRAIRTCVGGILAEYRDGKR